MDTVMSIFIAEIPFGCTFLPCLTPHPSSELYDIEWFLSIFYGREFYAWHFIVRIGIYISRKILKSESKRLLGRGGFNYYYPPLSTVVKKNMEYEFLEHLRTMSGGNWHPKDAITVSCIKNRAMNNVRFMLTLYEEVPSWIISSMSHHDLPLGELLRNVKQERYKPRDELYPVTSSLMTNQIDNAKLLLSQDWAYPELSWDGQNPLEAGHLCHPLRENKWQGTICEMATDSRPFIQSVKLKWSWHLCVSLRSLPHFRKDVLVRTPRFNRYFSCIGGFWMDALDGLDTNLKELIRWDEERRKDLQQVIVESRLFPKDVIQHIIMGYVFLAIPNELRNHDWRKKMKPLTPCLPERVTGAYLNELRNRD